VVIRATLGYQSGEGAISYLDILPGFAGLRARLWRGKPTLRLNHGGRHDSAAGVSAERETSKPQGAVRNAWIESYGLLGLFQAAGSIRVHA